MVALTLPPALWDATLGSGASQDARFQTRAAQERLEAALATLEPTHRDLLVQRFGLSGDGAAPCTIAALAEAAHVSRPVMRTREARALRALRTAWQKEKEHRQ